MTDEPKIPQVVVPPEVQAQIDKDPALAVAMRDMSAVLKDAMQGVEDGRYKSFEDAVEAMTGERPERVQPPNPPKHGYYLSLGPNPNGEGFMAVITDGHPKMGHEQIAICDVEVFQDEGEARKWYKSRCRTLPWESDDE